DALFQDRQLRVTVGFDQREAELKGERLGDFALGDQAERDEQRADLLVRFFLQAQRPIEPGRVELAALDQDLAEALARRRRLFRRNSLFQRRRLFRGNLRRQRRGPVRNIG